MGRQMGRNSDEHFQELIWQVVNRFLPHNNRQKVHTFKSIFVPINFI